MTTKKPTTKWKPPQRKPTEWPPDWKPTTEWKPPKKKLITEYNLPPRKPPKEVEPLTITKIKPPPGRSPMKIKPPPIGLGMEHPGLLKTPKLIKLKPAPRRSSTLKWNIKKR